MTFPYVTLIISLVNDIVDPHPIWVDEVQTFHAMLADLHTQPLIAVDTESNSLHAYREQVCLIQFSTPDHDYLLDPLAGMDLSPLGELFSSQDIEKIFHAAEYDIICLRRDYGFTFQNIFDTMQAARILGKEKVSLGDQLKAEFGLHLDKHNQKADWALRPLPPAMQTYACLDTHYLILLCQRMKNALQERGLMELAREDFERLCASTANGNHKLLYTQVSGYQDLNSRQLAVLDELCAYRDQRARAANRPHFKVINNQALLAIAQTCPRNRVDLLQIKAFSPRLFERHAEGLLRAVQRGVQSPPIDLPRRPRPDRRYLDRLDALKMWRKQVADCMGVLSDIILPRDILEEIAGQNPQTGASLQTIMGSVPWRFARFCAEILSVIKERQ